MRASCAIAAADCSGETISAAAGILLLVSSAVTNDVAMRCFARGVKYVNVNRRDGKAVRKLLVGVLVQRFINSVNSLPFSLHDFPGHREQANEGIAEAIRVTEQFQVRAHVVCNRPRRAPRAHQSTPPK